MARLFDEFEAFLAREGVTKATFCQFTGFPASTINSMRLAAAPSQTTVDRLFQAMDTWRSGRPIRRVKHAEARSPMQKHAPTLAMDSWAASAELSNKAFLAKVACVGGKFAPREPGRIIEDLAERRAAPSREPCPRCGVRGDIGCAHQNPMQEDWR